MSGAIKAIDRNTVHRICSGQVVLSLAVAVKELVENALDAGATTVEVKLKEYGSEVIEVADNGCGVMPNNFQGLTLKHHTSKLRDFSDLVGVETFGFRGEALSSLCALSELSISTRHGSQECGSNLVFDRNGEIVENVPCARQVGTTVTLVNIFSTLPVRHKEFHRNLKKEFNKMLQLLYAYCLVSTGVRISCSNQTKKGNKSVLVATQSSGSVKENVSSVFGSKQAAGLLELAESLPSPEVLDELKIDESACSIFKLNGLVSSCAHGSGRSAPDRQFYFINSRPCEPSKIAKAVNDVYHRYNLHQYPFVFLNVTVDKDSVDVNVTPDKRQIFLDNEKLLVAIIKTSLERAFKTVPSTYSVHGPEKTTGCLSSTSKATDWKPNLSIFNKWKSSNDSSKRKHEEGDDVLHNGKAPKISSDSSNESTQPTITRFAAQVRSENTSKALLEVCDSSLDVKVEILEAAECEGPQVEAMEVTERQLVSSMEEECELGALETPHHDSSVVNDSLVGEQIVEACAPEISLEPPLDESGARKESSLKVEAPVVTDDRGSACNSRSSIEAQSITYDTYEEKGNNEVIVSIDVEEIKSLSEKRSNRNDSLENVHFRAAIDPTKNDEAEHELRRAISKDRFKQMEIIGQFNLGFIITKLENDLFIIDQHASDEKFNFETLQKSTVISNQKLVVPQLLELTAANESVLMDNLEVFRKNGFEFNVDVNAQSTKKVAMTAVPLSVNRVFGKDDVDELLFMLQESDDKTSTCRPSSVRAMFASRACRKSVMVGTALSHREMKKLVSQMGTIEHPWNCPHGRPTMRHLANLELVKKT